MSRYTFPLSVQITLPDDYRTNQASREQLALIAERGLVGVEVNFARTELLDMSDLTDFLGEFGLRLTYFASGLTAKTVGLSLSAIDDAVRARSVSTMKDIMCLLAPCENGRAIIVGFLKGGPDTTSAPRQSAFRRSLDELVPIASETQVVICIEATNRYESCIANSLDETRALIEQYPSDTVEILPDTFHMNIEERDGFAALARTISSYRSIHLSDNTRHFPGFGAIDFEKTLRHLLSIGFSGGMALEGNQHDSFRSDLVCATDYLAEIESRIAQHD